MVQTAAPPADIVPFSLFEGDWLTRLFARAGLGGGRIRQIAGRCLLVFSLTWVPMALLALFTGHASTRIEGSNFFADFAAYAQFVIAVPLFLIAERIVSRSTREAAEHFVDSGLVAESDRAEVNQAHRETARLRTSGTAEIICVILACVLAAATIFPEIRAAGMRTWHVFSADDGTRTLTWPGAWAMVIALPILNYIWIRLAWKIVIWTQYLRRMSRLRLALAAAHPDLTGGLGFISGVQARFAVVLFAYGVSNVAAVIGYKIVIEHASPRLPPVWGPAAGFVIVAPLLFLAPLLMFSRQLHWTKQRAVARCREVARLHAIGFEDEWLYGQPAAPPDLADPGVLNHLAAIFERLERMRIVPFDWRSAGQLVGATIGSVATVLPLLKIEGSLRTWLEFLEKLLRIGGS
jgi:hypothetical protein